MLFLHIEGRGPWALFSLARGPNFDRCRYELSRLPLAIFAHWS